MCVFLSCSCSSTIHRRGWGQVWGVWTTSSPTLSLPEWTGPNRRRWISWECGDDQSHKLREGASWMISCLRLNTLFHISVSRDNTCFCTHLLFSSSTFFLYEISQEAVFYPFVWIAHFIISLRVYWAFFVCREHSTTIVWCNNNN